MFFQFQSFQSLARPFSILDFPNQNFIENSIKNIFGDFHWRLKKILTQNSHFRHKRIVIFWNFWRVFSTFLSFRPTFDHNLTIKMIARKWRIFWYVTRKKCGFSTKKFSKSPFWRVDTPATNLKFVFGISWKSHATRNKKKSS